MNLIIESKKLDTNWKRVTAALVTPPPLNNTENQSLILHLWLHRVYALEWMIKLEFDNKLKIHAPHGHKNDYKPLGELLRRIVVGCDRLLDGTGYASSADFFGCLVVEEALEGFSRDRGKSEDIKFMQSENAKLRSMENPFDKNTFPHTWDFVKLIIQRSEKSQNFKKEVFTPFLTARQALVKEMRTSKIISIRSEGDNFYFTRPDMARSRKKLPAKVK
ncbi:hypothetical protein NIES4106_61540 (plasmid) [Fischerella sp. NIES-4106]|nr:hypothetical protein NIES4106_61540 [Fischerella sp. NIES-4106]